MGSLHSSRMEGRHRVNPQYDILKRPFGVAEKQCRWCDRVQPVGEFSRSEKGWVTSECRTCAKERMECWAQVEAAPVVQGRRYVDENASHLVCTRCGRSRPKSLFYTFRDGKSNRRYYRPKCKQCAHADHNAYRVAYRNTEKQKRKNRDRWLRKKYGISLSEYEFYEYCQNWSCGICGTTRSGGPTPESAFHVDHDHETKRVRGLLCRACNTAIGLLKEDPELFTKAVTYLKQGGVFEPDADDEWPGCTDHTWKEEETDG